ncbi:hypothetical protein BV25DRAFT_1803578, partial [Artomyces pyxidatus]
MVELFIKHVLGVGTGRPGLYGDTAGYYGTVEQQGRLTLHLHMLLWIKNSLTPQEVRDRILGADSEFQKDMIQYLESAHTGEFLGGSMNDIHQEIQMRDIEDADRIDPTMTLPEAPPLECEAHQSESANANCEPCQRLPSWWSRFRQTVDELIFRSNRHTCHAGCTNKKYPSCKSRFPREVRAETSVDPETGSVQLKKGEAWINTFSPVLTYLIRCNSDVTSLLSGTAIKSIIAYVTDYVTKTPLKTHVILEVIKSVFNR